MIARAKAKPPLRPAATTRVRVAIYTRKSTEDGLDQEFNSLDAQRQAVEAYVTSQVGEGWVALAERYDDGGFTGANVERPAFQRLLGDIDAGRVDVVAVHRLDRLSRSLLDFTRLMELFRQREVAFVSVTQQFSTTTPVGRMTLNLLATFAEFERETIAERTRDKMGAARRRGMWTGGWPILGYDCVEKKLVVNVAEAGRVKEIFATYIRVGSLMATVEVLNRRGWKNKTWTKQSGEEVVGPRFTKNSLRGLLANPLYAGKTRYRDEIHPGAHDAIVDQATFDAVQKQLHQHARTGGYELRNKHGALLRGLLRCGACGEPMRFAYTSRGAKRYAFYVCAKALTEGASTCPGSRAPAGKLEAFVVEKVRGIGRDPAVLAATVAAAQRDLETRRPELAAAVQAHGEEARRLATERKNLAGAVARGVTGVEGKLAEVDRLATEAADHAQAAQAELAALETGTVDRDALGTAIASFDPVWNELFPQERARVLGLLIERVTYDPRAGEVVIQFTTGGIAALGRPA